MNEHANGTPLGGDQHWSVDQAASRLGRTPEKLSRLIASGAVKTVKRGPLGTRITDAEVRRFKSQRAQPAHSPVRRLPGLEERESALMLALWAAAGPLTISELHGTDPAKSAARLALRALDKLLEAGLVTRARREQHPHAWLYRAAVTPDEYAGRLAQQFRAAVSQARTA